MNDGYRNFEFELYSCLVQMKDVMTYYDTLDDILSELDNAINLVRSKKYNVPVVGEYRRGKSSLINAILGNNILPTDMAPQTASINRITYGSEIKVEIKYIDGVVQKIETHDDPNFLENVDKRKENTADSVKETIIHYPTEMCRNNIDIIDIPGFSDDAGVEQTLNRLADADSVIVVISAFSPYNENERDFVAKLIATKHIKKIVFVITFIDKLDESGLPQALQTTKSRICRMTNEALVNQYPDKIEDLVERGLLLDESKMTIYGVSTKMAIKYLAENDIQMLQKSGLPDLKIQLFKILTFQQISNLIEKTSVIIRNASKRFENLNNEKFLVLATDMGRLKTGRENIKSYFDGNKEFLDLFRRENYLNFHNILNCKNYVIDDLSQIFITELSKIKDNDPLLIVTAIENGNILAQYYLKNLMENSSRIIGALFSQIVGALSERRQTLLLNYVSIYTKSNISDAPKFISRIESLKTEIQRPSLIISDNLIPPITQIEHTNIIKHIQSILAQAIDDYLTEVKKYITANWALISTVLTEDLFFRDQIVEELTATIRKVESEILIRQSVYHLHKQIVEKQNERIKKVETQFL